MEDSFQVSELKADEVQKAIAYWEEVLQKSEKYERLMQDSDFTDILKDIQQTIDLHDTEIKFCLEKMSEYTPKLEQDAFHSIRVHQILKEQAAHAMRRPQEIVELAKKARVTIPQLQDQLNKLKEFIHG